MTSRSAIGLLVGISVILVFLNVDKRGLDVDELFSHSAAAGHIFWAPAPCFEEAEFTTDCIRDASSLTKGLEANATLDRTNSWIHVSGLFVWMKVFGYSQVAARSFSLLFYFLSAWLTGLFALNLFKDKLTARIAAGLFLLSPIAITLGWVTRGYSMAVFFGLLATYTLLKILEEPEAPLSRFIKLGVLYVLAASIGIFAHYNLAAFIGFHGLLVLLKFGFKWKELFKHAFLIGSAYIPFAIWFLPLKKYQVMLEMGSTADHWAEAVKNGTVPDVLQEGVLTEPSAYWVLLNWIRSIAGYLNMDLLVIEAAFSPAITMVAAILVVLPLWMIFKYLRKASGTDPMIHFFWMAPIIWLLLATFSSVTGGQTVAFFQRYTIFYIPFTLVLFAYAMAEMSRAEKKNWLAISGIAICLLVSVITAVPKYVDDLPGSYTSKINVYEYAAETIAANSKAGDLVIFSNRKGAFMTNLFMRSDNGLRLSLAQDQVEDRLLITVVSGEKITTVVDLETGKYE